MAKFILATKYIKNDLEQESEYDARSGCHTLHQCNILPLLAGLQSISSEDAGHYC